MCVQREYSESIDTHADVMSLEEWNRSVESGMFIPSDGVGYWAKDGKQSNDEVFSTEALDADSVVWYNK